MKLKSLLLSVGVLTASCANQTEPFRISKFYPLGAGCDVTANRESIVYANGNLDVAAGSPQFFLAVDITGGETIQQQAVRVGQVTLEAENRNRPLINQQIINYRLSKRVGPAPKPYITNINLPFTDNGEVFAAIQLISPELGIALFDGLVPTSGTAPSTVIEDFVDINVDVEFKGEFSATKHPFTTGVLTFPIRAYKSLPVDCGAGGFGYQKLATTYDTSVVPPVITSVEVCQYVGQSISQLVTPASPTCCTAAGPSGGGGC